MPGFWVTGAPGLCFNPLRPRGTGETPPWPRSRRSPRGFNPLRPRGTGETTRLGATADATVSDDVSIHSGPEGPERPASAFRLAASCFKFQSTPAPRDRRDNFNGQAAVFDFKFQSTPAPRDRRDICRS